GARRQLFRRGGSAPACLRGVSRGTAGGGRPCCPRWLTATRPAAAGVGVRGHHGGQQPHL
ncbi:MAG: FIG002813: LPPG:FO 2-phospho-L-lactate transferase like, CofD-like, partial [uncultured Propionibacteriaceae bacterium]